VQKKKQNKTKQKQKQKGKIGTKGRAIDLLCKIEVVLL
jgi:tRNA pseudouridine-54 N-methylase